MVQFTGCKLELQLEAQMPMIHFQSAQCGATIRASEVKPKLDRFILDKIMRKEGKSIQALKKDDNFKGIFLDSKSDKNEALDYKMQIAVSEQIQEIDLAPENDKDKLRSYSIFYANMGRNADEKVYGVFSNPTVTVICFKNQLRKYIEENIVKFFLTTNFGTMQNKGFGSFMPAQWCTKSILSRSQKEDIASYYNELNPGCHCYAMEFEGLSAGKAKSADINEACVTKSNEIKSFYSNMKSGQNFQGYSRSYLYQYMHEELEIGNEKAWMKKQGISPKLCKPQNAAKWEKTEAGFQEYYYVRAFLGTGTNIQYASKYMDAECKKIDVNSKKKVTIESVDAEKLERVPSPIYFKVIKNVVFIVAFEIPEELYGAEFEFDGRKYNNKKGRLKTPSTEVFAKTDGKFDIQHFMDKYVEYYNGELRIKITAIKKNKKVVRINA